MKCGCRGKEWHLGRFRRVVVYFRGLQTHTVDTKRPKCHSLCRGDLSFFKFIRGFFKPKRIQL